MTVKETTDFLRDLDDDFGDKEDVHVITSTSDLCREQSIASCPCNCHDPEARKAMNMEEHANCGECAAAIAKENVEIEEAELQDRCRRNDILVAFLGCVVDWGITARCSEEGLGMYYHCCKRGKEHRFGFIHLFYSDDFHVQYWDQGRCQGSKTFRGPGSCTPDVVKAETRKMCRFLCGEACDDL